MSDPHAMEGLATPAVARLCRMPTSTLNSWVREGLCGPSLIGSSGKRATRYWTIRDVVTVRAIKALRDAGCSMQNLRKVAGILAREWDRDLSEAVLFWEGGDVFTVDPAGSVVSLLRHTGQEVLRGTVVHHLSFPVGAWISEATEHVVVVDVAAITERREKRRIERGQEPLGRLSMR